MPPKPSTKSRPQPPKAITKRAKVKLPKDALNDKYYRPMAVSNDLTIPVTFNTIRNFINYGVPPPQAKKQELSYLFDDLEIPSTTQLFTIAVLLHAELVENKPVLTFNDGTAHFTFGPLIDDDISLDTLPPVGSVVRVWFHFCSDVKAQRKLSTKYQTQRWVTFTSLDLLHPPSILIPTTPATTDANKPFFNQQQRQEMVQTRSNLLVQLFFDHYAECSHFRFNSCLLKPARRAKVRSVLSDPYYIIPMTFHQLETEVYGSEDGKAVLWKTPDCGILNLTHRLVQITTHLDGLPLPCDKFKPCHAGCTMLDFIDKENGYNRTHYNIMNDILRPVHPKKPNDYMNTFNLLSKVFDAKQHSVVQIMRLYPRLLARCSQAKEEQEYYFKLSPCFFLFNNSQSATYLDILTKQPGIHSNIDSFIKDTHGDALKTPKTIGIGDDDSDNGDDDDSSDDNHQWYNDLPSEDGDGGNNDNYEDDATTTTHSSNNYSNSDDFNHIVNDINYNTNMIKPRADNDDLTKSNDFLYEMSVFDVDPAANNDTNNNKNNIEDVSNFFISSNHTNNEHFTHASTSTSTHTNHPSQHITSSSQYHSETRTAPAREVPETTNDNNTTNHTMSSTQVDDPTMYLPYMQHVESLQQQIYERDVAIQTQIQQQHAELMQKDIDLQNLITHYNTELETRDTHIEQLNAHYMSALSAKDQHIQRLLQALLNPLQNDDDDNNNNGQ